MKLETHVNADEFFNNEVNDMSLDYIITHLKIINSENNTVDEISSKYGQPQWDEYEVSVSGSVIGYTIPIVKHTDSNVSNLYVFQIEDDTVSIYLINKDDKSVILNNEEWRFDYFTQKLFGPQADFCVYKDIQKKKSVGGINYTMVNMLTCHYIDYYVNGEYYHTKNLGCERSGGDGSSIGGSGGWRLGPSDNKVTFPKDRGGSGGRSYDDGDNPTIKDQFTVEKAKCVYDKLEPNGNTLLAKLLDGFKDKDGDIGEFNVTFINSSLKSNVNGLTTVLKSSKKLELQISISDELSSKKPIEIARTILHEAFHAYIFYKIKNKGGGLSLYGDENFIKDYNEYKEEFKEGNVQHNWMADRYISFMKSGLKEFFKDQEGRFENSMNDVEGWEGCDSMYEYLAWAGLKEKNQILTDAWDKYPNKGEVFRFNSIIKNFLPSECK